MPTSYTVMSEHYEGDLSTSEPIKVAPEDIKSMESIPISVSSYPYGDYKPSIVKGKSGKIYAATRTANNLFLTSVGDFSKYGFFSQIDDFNMDEFKSAGEDVRPNMFDIVPKMPDIGYITDITPRRMNFPDPRDTAVDLYSTPEFVNAVDMNKVGYFVSKVGNLQQFLRNNVLFNDTNNIHYDINRWVEFLDGKGFSFETSRNAEFSGLGVQVDVEREGYLAAYFPRKGYLITEADFHDKVEKLISAYGLEGKESVEAMMRADMLHEIGHRLGIGGDRASEELQGELREEFYSKLAEEFKGTRFERIYRALVQEGMDYARAFSMSTALWDEISAELHTKRLPGAIPLLADKFEEEADALELTGWNRIAFIEKRLREVYGELLAEEPSFKESLNQKSLEEMVEELGQEFYCPTQLPSILMPLMAN